MESLTHLHPVAQVAAIVVFGAVFIVGIWKLFDLFKHLAEN